MKLTGMNTAMKTNVVATNAMEMPPMASTVALYVYLNLNADDDGFVNNSKKIMKMMIQNMKPVLIVNLIM